MSWRFAGPVFADIGGATMAVLTQSTSGSLRHGTLAVEHWQMEEPRVRGDRIRALREAKKMRQSDLAYLAGIAVSFLSEIERGNRNPGAHVVARIADVLQTSMDYLMGRTDDPRPASDLLASGFVRPKPAAAAMPEPTTPDWDAPPAGGPAPTLVDIMREIQELKRRVEQLERGMGEKAER